MSSVASQQLLIQVVPRLRPGRCGVSDQAMLLARELKDNFGIDSAFVVLNSNEQSSLPQAAIYCPASELLESCLELTQGHPGFVLTHVSGYGYSSDGAPTLLADALEKVNASFQFRIAAYFHELFATGRPWTSAFWYSHRQKKAVRRIVPQCEFVVTNIGRHADWLKNESRVLGGIPVEQMPVFSPAGEAHMLIPFEQRNPAIVVFGLAPTREWGYRKLAVAGNLLQTLGIHEILDVGPDCNHPADVSGIPVRQIGSLAMDELADVLSRSRFGFVHHPMDCLGKSSVFAAYCAQGTISVLAEPFPEEADGLREGLHVISPRTVETARKSGLENCSRAAWNWYMEHRLRVHVERYVKWIDDRQ